jgi:membrane protein
MPDQINILPVPLAKKITKWWRTFTLPGFDGLPVYEVINHMVAELKKQPIGMRVGSVSYNFLMATFPGILFLFTLIAFIPIHGFQSALLTEMEKILPKDSYPMVKRTIIDIIRHQRGGLLSFTLLASLWYSMSGVRSLISAFDKKQSTFLKRNALKKLVIAFRITVLLNLNVLVSLGLIVGGKNLAYLVVKAFHWSKYIVPVFNTINWVFMVTFYSVGISVIYYYGPATAKRWKFFNTGSLLATFAVLVTSLGFSAFIQNFGRYNTLYGSIGALIIVIGWINLTAWVLIICFELNAAIDFVRKKLEMHHK